LSFTDESIREYIGYVSTAIDTEVINGMISDEEARAIQRKLSEAIIALTPDPEKHKEPDVNVANDLSREAWYDFVNYLNNKPRRYRLLYMYAIHIWALLVALAVLLLTLISLGIINHPIFVGISGDMIAWGGLGGSGYAIFHLRDDVAGFNLSKYQATYWSVYPFAGMIFGLAIAFIIASGLLSLGASPTYPVYATISFLAGLFQQWVLATLKDVAETIHKTEKG